MGDPFDTWTYRDDSGGRDDRDDDHDTQRRPLWLRDFLPETIPQARILTFGYDADIKTKSVLGIMGFAENLLSSLSSIRNEGVSVYNCTDTSKGAVCC
jgi:hypothetical protein